MRHPWAFISWALIMGQNNGNIQYNGSAADNVYFMIAQVCDHIWVCLELKQLDCYVN